MSIGRMTLTILGCNSAKPCHGRFQTSQILQLGNETLLLDCGEGAQIRMMDYKVKKSRISTVLISHMHGDHLYGLPGFIGSLSIDNRNVPLTIYGPVGIKTYLSAVFTASQAHLSIDLVIHEIAPVVAERIFLSKDYQITAFPVSHRVPTYGFLVEEINPTINVEKSAISRYSLTIPEIKKLKAGQDLVRGDQIIDHRQLTLGSKPLRSYAYCADTTVAGWNTSVIENTHTLYFETTYLDELRTKAHQRKHSTAREAGELAKQLGVNRLVIGHYSSQYRDIQPLLDEAKAYFENTVAGYDGLILEIE